MKEGLRIYSMLLLTLALTSLCHAQTVNTDASVVEEFERTIHTMSVLPEDNVNAIVQSDDGMYWLITTSFLVRYDGHEFVTFKPQVPHHYYFTPHLNIDPYGHLWFGDRYAGIHIFDPKTNEFYRIKPASDSLGVLSSRYINGIEFDKNNHAWIATQNGLNHIVDIPKRWTANTKLKCLHYFDDYASQKKKSFFADTTIKLLDNELSSLDMDANGRLFIASESGIDVIQTQSIAGNKLDEIRPFRLDSPWYATAILSDSEDLHLLAYKKTENLSFYIADISLQNNEVVLNDTAEYFTATKRPGNNSRLFLGVNNLWLSAPDGQISNCRKINGNLSCQPSEVLGRKSRAYNVMVDTWGNEWFCAKPGLYKIQSQYDRPIKLDHNVHDETQLIPLTNDKLIYQKSDSLILLNYETSEYKLLNINSDPYYRVPSNSDGIHIAHGNQVYRLSKDENTLIELYSMESDDKAQLIDKHGRLLFSRPKYLERYLRHQLYVLEADSARLLNPYPSWRIVYANDFWSRNINTGVQHGKYNADSVLVKTVKTRYPSMGVTALDVNTLDDNKVILSTLKDGIFIFDKTTYDSIQISRGEGLYSNKVWRTKVDSKNRIWTFTSEGVNLLVPDTRENLGYRILPVASIQKYFKSNFRKIVELDPLDRLIFTMNDELVYLDTKNLFSNANSYKLKLISLIQDEGEKIIDDGNDISLEFNNRDFDIQFTALGPILDAPYTFEYRMLGVNDRWTEVDDERKARFSGLKPGSYTFELKARSPNGIEIPDQQQLNITIRPPWYRTWWAYIVYGLLLAYLFYWIFQQRVRQIRKDGERLRLKEVNELKTKLYTNITHEFRSPLTVILGMTDQLKEYVELGEENKFEEGRRLIRRNGKRLLQLVNQMLDLSKVDAHKFNLNIVQQDITQSINYIVESYHSLAFDKKIELICDHEAGEVIMDFDPDVIQKIISNLLTNAIKFSHEDSKVVINTKRDAEDFYIEIQDEGQGILPQDLPHVFDRFYQVDKISRAGTGVGLALTKELVEQLDGQILVQSEPGTGSVFKVSLPIQNEAPMMLSPSMHREKVNQELTTIPLSGGQIDAPVVLIVEDNREVAYYIGSCLEKTYGLIYAEDGQAGIDLAIENTPDFIISDVMMPNKSGYEVVAELKDDIRTSHIPIVLLTAKVGEDSKLEGLRKGADAYLTKPFNKEELLVRVEQLIELRQKLRLKYNDFDFTEEVGSKEIIEQEDSFIMNLRELVLADISADLNVTDLCLKIGMSRSQLHRKLSALTDQSTTQFIRKVRFNKAKELLRDTDLTISEIAYETGFRTPSYFSRMFSKENGMSPSDYRES